MAGELLSVALDQVNTEVIFMDADSSIEIPVGKIGVIDDEPHRHFFGTFFMHFFRNMQRHIDHYGTEVSADDLVGNVDYARSLSQNSMSYSGPEHLAVVDEVANIVPELAASIIWQTQADATLEQQQASFGVLVETMKQAHERNKEKSRAIMADWRKRGLLIESKPQQ